MQNEEGNPLATFWPPFGHLFDVLPVFVVSFECINNCKIHNYK